MSVMTQLQIAWEMWKDYMKQTFGGGLYFPTAPSFQPGYTK